ncbi:MAG: hypothetical protein FD180_2607 [Planctomycetota bacterium]|nr:MAG: hypothetical protein FD180_2607 [Planctomycetota bacterium]
MNRILALALALSTPAFAEWFKTIDEAEKASAERRIPLLVYVWQTG